MNTGRTLLNQRLASLEENALAPMVELLADELQAVGIDVPYGHSCSSGKHFSVWYLQAVQALEAYVADSDAHAPMSRGEVELMCRCALTASTLGEAIELITQFCVMLNPRAGALSLKRVNGHARLVTDSLRSHRSMASSLVDIAGLFAFKQLFQWLTGGCCQISLVGIGSIPRNDLLPFLLLFNAPVVADGKQPYLEFDVAALAATVVASPGDFPRFFERFPCALFELETDLEQQVSAILTAAVNQASRIPAQHDVALSLGIPLSTFRRRLTDQGTNFKAIRERCLLEGSQLLLRHEYNSVQQIAQRLGFSDADSFRHAFKRWTGLSPSAWRLLNAS